MRWHSLALPAAVLTLGVSGVSPAQADGVDHPRDAATGVRDAHRGIVAAHWPGSVSTILSTQSADATQQAATKYELQAERDAAAAQAAKHAAADLKEAKAEAKKKAEASRKAAAEPATGSAGRTTLTSASTAPAPAGGSVATVISFLEAQVGDAYVMGATGPNAWDCSGLVQATFRQAGVDLPRVSQDQSTVGTEVSLSNLQVGDILYWGAKGSAYHTGVYIGQGQYLDAANPSKGVVIQDLSGYPATGAVRVL
ncbi:C40 family peptidase [Streptomyces phyllanthi]|uniref:NlpC/P60 family protein n=1 Tax=Streptomyces phyllanthi TaxID=1803180 RepID=A0A5N8VXH7_9ACTN|nr:C40 family peptidase [Streptomyces phyllanthi]MPY39970.1 NlpC/P60 family protein [Streptomyces phyllanthi]